MYDYLIKIILIGSTNVGKTTFRSQITGKTLSDTTSTIGVEFDSTITSATDGNTIKIQLFDTAGQEYYHAIVKNYYRDIAGAIFMFDLSNYETFLDIQKFWINEFENNNQSYIKNILIGNKSDLKREVDYTVAKTFAKKHDMEYYEISTLQENNFYYFDIFIESIYLNKPEIIKEGIGIKKYPKHYQSPTKTCCNIQ